ncbi:hypothetical protein PLICBS_003857 [Purpureocillium lilacinum]|uniref:uncharacterized protein n=1 Tax=Purpureocillium lilacinum TaxID=33203 RepID=UPI00207E04AD|nr:hypothetical protein PLICBS_003857 [Purpureocillium lilacinum]
MGEANSDGTDIAEVSVIHAIVIPNYMEEIDTIKETLAVLAFHPQAYCSYDVFLAMEQREVNSETKALSLIQMFATRFRSIDYTVHPADIPGEAAGKGSNIGWAARYLSAKYSTETRKSVIVTGIDADSHLLPSYFTKITKMHLSHSATANTTLYSVPIIFDRNAHNVPAIVRVADILWSAAGISGLHRSSATAPPTSVYSLPLELIDRVGGWDGDAEAIGEDLHMYLKCFFALNGNLTCRTVLSPVSQSNVTGGGKGGIRGTIIDMRARYNQALRHMWGALDVGFALRQAVKMWRERQHTTRAFYPLHKNVAVNPNCCFPNGRLHNGNTQLPDETGNFSDITHATVKGPHWENLIYLFHRLFEAHFLPVHMTILVLTLALYDWVSADMQYSNGLRRIFSLCSVLRMLGFLEVGYYIFLYEGFHRLCVMTRKRAMTYAGLADEMYFSQRSIRKNLVDYALVPLVAPLYGAIPCAQAATTHFWTVDLVYSVSKKASRQQQKPALPGSMA